MTLRFVHVVSIILGHLDNANQNHSILAREIKITIIHAVVMAEGTETIMIVVIPMYTLVVTRCQCHDLQESAQAL